jgi:hypothetical protein
MFDNLFAPEHLLVILVILLIVVVPFWQIFKKAGFSPLFSLLMPIPLVGFVMIYVLAFAPWRPTQGQTFQAR